MTESSEFQPYPTVSGQVRFPAIEERVLDYWRENGIFQESISQRDGAKDYVFYDGPPFANGLPHYGHLLTGYVKDVVPRYQTMRGRRVDRRFGWDCHGLPAEMEAEKELKVAGREQIEAFGIDKYNDACRRSVLRYTGEWESYVTRQARWVDFERDYKTMDLSYMESVMWAFKQLYEKGLCYEGHKVMPYSWAMETPVSNHETRMDDATRPRQDPAVTVAFRLEPREGDPAALEILAWTTTPWTLPSNLALAVGADIDYAIVRLAGDRHFVLAEAALGSYEKELGDHEVVGRLKGADLEGRTYEPLMPYFAGHENAFRVLIGEFVDTGEGTGIVHMAPGFGEDDQKTCEANDIQLVCPVDAKGRYTAEISDYEGQLVFDANKPIIQRLKQEGKLLKHVTYEHNYPHCWRTREPLIYKAIPGAWFVKVTAIKERMLELNQQIRWIPGHVRDGQFGKWLENARDWSISRNRYWGAPLPVWKSDNPEYPRVDVYGSLDEIERDFGVRPDDLHRPTIDQLTRPNPDDPSGQSTMRRVEEVLDCWFESGSMPFAQVHYPFENKEWFEQNFPSDFIVEYVAQTRGWFYTMVVLGTALFDKPPFRNCICHGVVLDETRQKLSKSLRNYPDPEQVFQKTGSDALRWFLVSSPILRGNDLQIHKDGRDIEEVVRLVINPVWNAWTFYTLYANTDELRGQWRTDSTDLLDRYILAKTRELVECVEEAMDRYELADASQRVLTFLDALNNWYIRRSRGRFWKAEKDEDKRAAYDTLFTVLSTLCRVAAPLLPLITEEIYRGLTGARSVHLEDWPDAASLPEDRALVAEMDRVRDACSTGLALREAHKLRIRLPLASITVAGEDAEALRPYEHLLRDELNVKGVLFSTQLERFGTFRLQVNAKVVGPKLGKDMKKVMAASKQGDWYLSGDGTAVVGGVTLDAGDFELRLMPAEGVASQALPSNDMVAVLDVEVTPELEREGLARDLVRLVQQARKNAGLEISNRIHLRVELAEEVAPAIEEHQTYVADQTLATRVTFGAPGEGMHTEELSLGGTKGRLALEVDAAS